LLARGKFLPAIVGPDIVISRGREASVVDDGLGALVDDAIVVDKRNAVPELHVVGNALDRHFALVS
jgi:hypothetical protein